MPQHGPLRSVYGPPRPPVKRSHSAGASGAGVTGFFAAANAAAVQAAAGEELPSRTSRGSVRATMPGSGSQGCLPPPPAPADPLAALLRREAGVGDSVRERRPKAGLRRPASATARTASPHVTSVDSDYSTHTQQAGPSERHGLMACAVCRNQPVVFRECPSCAARYCARGCLESWYDHSKPSRASSCEAAVVSAEDDILSTRLAAVEDDGSTRGAVGMETKLRLTRLACGEVLVNELSGQGRWGLCSVDGWELGTPGPGVLWKPARGVKLKLEALGCCRACQSSLAMTEYICNGASRPSSARAVRGGNSDWRKRPTADAETQTEPDIADIGVQVCAETQEANVQIEPPIGFVVSHAWVLSAGASVAALAAPADAPCSALRSLAGETTPELTITASPDLARRLIRDALTSVARVAAQSLCSDNVGESGEAFAAAAEAVRSLASSPAEAEAVRGNASPTEASSVACCAKTHNSPRRGRLRRRVLGHRRKAALPRFVEAAKSDSSGVSWVALTPHFLPDSGAALLAGALGALKDLEGYNGRTGSAQKSYQEELKLSESILLNVRRASTEEQESDPEAGLRDALANLVALLSSRACEQGSSIEEGDVAVAAVASVASLLPAPEVAMPPCWHTIAESSTWPWFTSSETTPPNGWPLISHALATLVKLTKPGAANVEDVSVSLRALGQLALFIDAEAAKFEDIQEANAKAAASKEATLLPSTPNAVSGVTLRPDELLVSGIAEQVRGADVVRIAATPPVCADGGADPVSAHLAVDLTSAASLENKMPVEMPVFGKAKRGSRRNPGPVDSNDAVGVSAGGNDVATAIGGVGIGSSVGGGNASDLASADALDKLSGSLGDACGDGRVAPGLQGDLDLSVTQGGNTIDERNVNGGTVPGAAGCVGGAMSIAADHDANGDAGDPGGAPAGGKKAVQNALGDMFKKKKR